MTRIVIIDDEQDSREILQLMLTAYCPDVMVAGCADGVADGFRLICREMPDIVLLDIRMEDGSGFDLLDKFREPAFRVIFTTAYDDQAIRAFKYRALDYLLKPVEPAALVEAISRISAKSDVKASAPSISPENLPGKIPIQVKEGILMLGLSGIKHIESDRSYTWCYLDTGDRILVSRTIADMERELPEEFFFRIHNSHIVNIRFVRKYLKEGGFVVLDDNTQLLIARRRKEAFLDWLKKRRL